MIHGAGPGDKLASGARSAVFAVAPNIKFNEAQMMDDFRKLSSTAFQEKYMMAPMEYDRMVTAVRTGNEEKVNDFATRLREKAEAAERELAADERQETSLRRECFLAPRPDTIIVDRDLPPKRKSTILMPPKAQRDRELLPTTGHVIKAGKGMEAWLGKRVLFQQMSGQIICFKRYPTWVQLQETEIMCEVLREDVDVVEEKLESMV